MNRKHIQTEKHMGFQKRNIEEINLGQIKNEPKSDRYLYYSTLPFF